MIEQIEKSDNLLVPHDQKTAHAALQFYGMIEAGIGIRPATGRERAADLARLKNEADAIVSDVKSLLRLWCPSCGIVHAGPCKQ